MRLESVLKWQRSRGERTGVLDSRCSAGRFTWGSIIRFSPSVMLFLGMTAWAIDPEPGADVWLTNAPPLPAAFTRADSDAARFDTLRAEAIAGRLRISWEASERFSNARVVSSADAPGHWPARDWRSYGMQSHGTRWQVEVPVDSLDVPLIYFVLASNDWRAAASPMRIARPGALGLEQPTRLFWPFLEGFEQGFDGWRAIHGLPLRLDATAKNGRAALAATIFPGEKTVTLVTTRVRGWFVQEHRATGLELWLRTRSGTGRAAFGLLANAFSTNQVMARGGDPVTLDAVWKRIEVPFVKFAKFPFGDLDLVSIELTGEPGTEFLLDDVQLRGRWRTDL